MQIEIHGDNVVVTADLKSRIQQQLLTALGPLLERCVDVAHVRVHDSVDNGAGLKSCDILLTLLPSGGQAVSEVGAGAVTEVGASLEAAVERAAQRAAVEVGRELERRGMARFAFME